MERNECGVEGSWCGFAECCVGSYGMVMRQCGSWWLDRGMLWMDAAMCVGLAELSLVWFGFFLFSSRSGIGAFSAREDFVAISAEFSLKCELSAA